MDDALVSQYAVVQRFGFRVKLQCIRCGVLFDLDCLDFAIDHSRICRGGL